MGYRYVNNTTAGPVAGIAANGGSKYSADADVGLDTLVAAGLLHRIPTEGGLVETKSVVTATVGATLTAAEIVSKVIDRTGPTANYSDATDTAANIIAAIPNADVGVSFELTIINGVAFTQTLTGGTGVTLSGTTAIAASGVRRYLVTITNVASPAVTIMGLFGASA